MNNLFAYLTTNPYFGLALTFGAFFLADFLCKKLKITFLNPLLIAIAIVIGVLLAFDIPYEDYNLGASQFSFLLGPVTVAFAVPLYKQLDVLKKNFAVIMTGIVSGCLASVASVFACCKLLGLSPVIYYSLIPKSITSSIAVSVSEEIGGISALTVALVVLTGLLGAAIASGMVKLLHLKNKVAIGLAIGTCSHAIGTSRAMQMGEVDGAMSSLAIVVAGVVTVFLAPVAAMLL